MVTQPLPRSPASGPLATLTSVSSAATCAQMYLSVPHSAAYLTVGKLCKSQETGQWHGVYRCVR